MRPDSDEFNKHAAHFERIDKYLDEFASTHGFSIQKNHHRTPCRVLRKVGKLELMIDIYQNGDWKTTPYSKALPHSVGLAAHYTKSERPELVVYRFTTPLAKDVLFSEIENKLEEHLKDSLNILIGITPDFMIKNGKKLE